MSIPIQRSTELAWGPQFRPSLAEGPVSVYELKTSPDTESEDNLIFSLRAPGNRLLCSSKDAYIQQTFHVACVGDWSETTVGAPVLRSGSTSTNARGAAILRQGQKIAFGCGNPYQDAITSANLIINNQSISQSNQDAYMRALTRYWVSDDIQESVRSRLGPV